MEKIEFNLKIDKMKREIKFRGKRTDTGKWIIGDFHDVPVAHGHLPHIYLESGDEEIEYEGWVQVERDSIGEYTGLKDKNGIEIYDGSLLQETSPRGNKYKVFSVTGGFAINTHQDDFSKANVQFYSSLADIQTASYIKEQCEVIGNIYSTPRTFNPVTT